MQSQDGVWEREFGNSHERWLRAVADDLRDWGFNTIGWTQEVVIITEGYHRHSRPFTYEEYQWANMPYCHLLPFTEAHQWQVEVRMPDLMSSDFEEWCKDYVARDECVRLRDDPKLNRLLGLMIFSQWVHTSYCLRSGVSRWTIQTCSNQWRNAAMLSAIAETVRPSSPTTVSAATTRTTFFWAIDEANALTVRGSDPCGTALYVLSFQCFGTAENIAKDAALGRLCRPTGAAWPISAGHSLRAHGDTSWPPTADPIARYRPLSPGDGRTVA